jgi:hypothetical protein
MASSKTDFDESAMWRPILNLSQARLSSRRAATCTGATTVQQAELHPTTKMQQDEKVQSLTPTKTMPRIYRDQ